MLIVFNSLNCIWHCPALLNSFLSLCLREKWVSPFCLKSFWFGNSNNDPPGVCDLALRLDTPKDGWGVYTALFFFFFATWERSGNVGIGFYTHLMSGLCLWTAVMKASTHTPAGTHQTLTCDTDPCLSGHSAPACRLQTNVPATLSRAHPWQQIPPWTCSTEKGASEVLNGIRPRLFKKGLTQWHFYLVVAKVHFPLLYLKKRIYF